CGEQPGHEASKNVENAAGPERSITRLEYCGEEKDIEAEQQDREADLPRHPGQQTDPIEPHLASRQFGQQRAVALEDPDQSERSGPHLPDHAGTLLSACRMTSSSTRSAIP